MRVRRIVVAAGSLSDRELLSEIATELDKRSTIISASNAREFIRSVGPSAVSELPDLIILEYELPGMLAEEILHLLKKTPGADLTLKVVWTATTDRKVWQKCQELGAHLLLPKSTLPGDLKMALANLMLSFPKMLAV